MKDISIYKCPNCFSLLNQLNDNSLKCLKNHNFDLAKEGYFNLILANQKKSLNSGDNLDMVRARENFLTKNYYDFLIQEISNLIGKTNNSEKIFDAGCGTGYYLDRLANLLNIAQTYGCDISKTAIKVAAKKYPNSHFIVANNYHLPYFDNSFDLVLSIFAPLDEKELSRIINTNGRVIVVRPNNQHLIELYQAIGIKVREKNKTDLFPNLKLLKEQHLLKEISIKDPTDLLNLLSMTPLLRILNSKNLDITKLQINKVTFDVNISIFSKEQWSTITL